MARGCISATAFGIVSFLAGRTRGRPDHRRPPFVKLVGTRKQMGRPGRPIVCIETGQVYPSICAAARAVDKDEKTLRMAIAANRQTAGYYWAYQDGLGPGSHLKD
eukprot:g37902.t1